MTQQDATHSYHWDVVQLLMQEATFLLFQQMKMWDIVRRTRRCTGDRLLSLAWWCRELVLHLMLVKVWASVQLTFSPVSSHESCFLLHHPLSVLHILVQVVSTESLSAEFQPVQLPCFWSESCVFAWQRWVQTQAWVGRATDLQRLSVTIKSFQGVCLRCVYKESEHFGVFSSEEWLGSLLLNHPRLKE